jgi:hypothetical protein
MSIGVLLVILVVTLVLIVAPPRGGQDAQRICAACGAVHPPFALFCRRCGKRL